MSFLETLAEIWNETEVKKTNKDFAPLPKGEYVAVIDKALINETTMRVEFEFIIDKGDFKNRRLWTTLGLNDTGIQFLKAALDILEEPCSDIKLLPQTLEKLIFKKVVLGVTQREYQGKVYNNCYINDIVVSKAKEEEELPF